MAAITWQNISGADYSNAARTLDAAQQRLDAGFGNLGDILKKREATDTANWDTGKVNNTQAFLDEVAKYRTPEEFQAAQQSGVLDRMRQGFGAQVDANAARTAQDGRLATLQQRGLADINYNTAVTNERELPIRDNISALTSQGKFGEAQALLDQHNLRNEAALFDAVRSGQRRVTTEGQADTTFDNQQAVEAQNVLMRPLDLAAKRAAIAASQASTNASNAASAERRQAGVANKLLLGYQQHYTDAQNKWNTGASKIANEMKIPLDKSGRPDFTNIDAETGKAYKARLATLGDIASSSAYLADFSKRMTDAGVPVKQQIEGRDTFDKLFGTGSVTSASDAAILKAGAEKIDARLKSVKDNNPFIKPGADDLAKEQTAVIGMITSGVKGDGEYFTKGPLKEEAMALMTKGLNWRDAAGKPQVTVIPPALMKLALTQSMESDTALWNGTIRGAKDFLKEKLRDPEFMKLQQQAEEFNTDPTGIKARTALADSLTNQQGIQSSPRGLMTSLDEAIRASDRRSAIEAQKKSPELANAQPTVVPPAVGSTAKPAIVATPVPKGSTVSAAQDVSFNLSTGATAATSSPLVIPTDIKFGAPKTVAQATIPGGKQGVVTFVPDADGVNLKMADGSNLSCRLHMIDAPEVAHAKRTTKAGKVIEASPDQAYGQEARYYLMNKIQNKEVSVVVTQSESTNKEGRNYCQVSFEGQDMSMDVLQAGFAHVYDKYVKPELASKAYDAQLSAKRNRRGMWKMLDEGKTPMTGEAFRNQYR